MARRRFRSNQRHEPTTERSFQEYILSTPAPQTSRTELLRLIRGGEDTFLELKVKLSNTEKIAQEIVDAFFQDLDYSMRELGIGDQGVPKRMKKFAGMFYGRLESYASALDADDQDALAAALRRNIYPQADEPAPDMRGLANWIMAASRMLSAQPEEAVATGSVTLPSPDTVRFQ